MQASSRRELFSRAMRLLDLGDAGEAFSIGEELLSSGEESSIISGLMCCGFALEQGGKGLSQDLDRALHFFLKAALAVPHLEADLNIARILIKRGSEADLLRAKKYLDDAKHRRACARVNLGYAELYRTSLLKDVKSEQAHLWKAALSGRFAGFFGLSRSLRREGRLIFAFLVDSLRVALGPVIALLLGAKAHEKF